jgi:hypothetical protein
MEKKIQEDAQRIRESRERSKKIEEERTKRFFDSSAKVWNAYLNLSSLKRAATNKEYKLADDILLLTTDRYTSTAYSEHYTKEKHFKVITTKNIGNVKSFNPKRTLIFVDHKLSKNSAKWLSDNNYHFVINIDLVNSYTYRDHFVKRKCRYILVSSKVKESIIHMYGNQNVDKILKATEEAEKIKNLVVVDNKKDFETQYNQIISESNVRPIVIFHNNNGDIQFLDSRINVNKIPYGITCHSFDLDTKITSTGYLNMNYLIQSVKQMEEDSPDKFYNYFEFIQTLAGKYTSFEMTDNNHTAIIVGGIGAVGIIYIYCSTKKTKNSQQ